MIKEHDTEEKISIKRFLELIKRYNEQQIETTAHTFFRISQKQRKVYNDEKLKRYIINEKPVEVIKQYNGNLSALYVFEDTDQRIKIVLNLQANKVYIVTFYILNKEQRGRIGK